MIVIDTSALVAIITGEAEHVAFNRKVASDHCYLSAGSYVETHIVIATRLGEAGTRELSLYLHEADITIMPVDREQADLARTAFHTFGKGRHAASLNFGDCFSYALAKGLGAPILSKGDDFSKSDLQAA